MGRGATASLENYGGIAKREQAENDNNSTEKTLYTIHVHGQSPAC